MRSREQGMAMITAMAVVVVISLMGTAALNLTFRRLQLSAFRTDRAVAGAEAEAGVQYAFGRLTLNDTSRLQDKNGNQTGQPNVPFQTRVQNDANGLLISCDNTVTGLDHWEPSLHVGAKVNTERNSDNTPGPQYGNYLGGKHVTVKITYDDTPGAAQPYKISSKASFGVGFEERP